MKKLKLQSFEAPNKYSKTFNCTGNAITLPRRSQADFPIYLSDTEIENYTTVAHSSSQKQIHTQIQHITRKLKMEMERDEVLEIL